MAWTLGQNDDYSPYTEEQEQSILNDLYAAREAEDEERVFRKAFQIARPDSSEAELMIALSVYRSRMGRA